MENLTGGTPPVRPLPCVVPCKLYFKDVETNLNNAILSAQRASMTDDELVQLLKLLLEVSDE